jgi:uncharacterized OB-fold protein
MSARTPIRRPTARCGLSDGLRVPTMKPAPIPTPETQPYWDAALNDELRIQRCLVCGEFYFYPRPFCPRCHSDQVVWVGASGRAILYSYVIVHQPIPGFEEEVPYVLAVVALAEGPRLMTNIVGIEPVPEALPLDLALEVVFEPRGAWKVPCFAPVGWQRA